MAARSQCSATKKLMVVSDRYLKRAGLDYWPYVQLTTHPDWSAFQQQQQQQGGRLIAFTTKGDLNYLDFEFQENNWLIYGRETSGLPDAVMASCDVWLRIPITQPGVRSLNLSVSVAIGLFEARRQVYFAPR
ncbi:TrmH family RNA methyltransferase [Synechococcus elongatus IITB7]|uniref:tRNA (cytidine(34)-2'-O)-methyltransferase n=1 Tax=Synechococcus elongatus TaxID=32046 RepID=UPI0030CACE32